MTNLLYQLLYIHRFVECYMIKIKIAIAIFVISIVGIIVNSPGLAIPNAQSTSDEGSNNTQSFDDDNKAQTSDDDNILTFNQELLLDLSPSNQ